jgi:hypothetical protein
MIKVVPEGDKVILSVQDSPLGGKDLGVWWHELDQLIADLQEAAVRLKANQLTEGYATPKSPTEKLEDEIAQLKERVNMLEHNNFRKL